MMHPGGHPGWALVDHGQADRPLGVGEDDFRWIPSEAASPSAPSPPSWQAVADSSTWAEPAIVVVLTVVCTALALYDLFLLASGA
jgi:hypothetical protein